MMCLSTILNRNTEGAAGNWMVRLIRMVGREMHDKRVCHNGSSGSSPEGFGFGH